MKLSLFVLHFFALGLGFSARDVPKLLHLSGRGAAEEPLRWNKVPGNLPTTVVTKRQIKDGHPNIKSARFS